MVWFKFPLYKICIGNDSRPDIVSFDLGIFKSYAKQKNDVLGMFILCVSLSHGSNVSLGLVSVIVVSVSDKNLIEFCRCRLSVCVIC